MTFSASSARRLIASATTLMVLGWTAPMRAGRAGVGAALPGDDAAVLHVLNRLGFGPRPGDVARVRQIGLDAYIDQQLHPDRISDDALKARLKAFPTLTMNSREMA